MRIFFWQLSPREKLLRYFWLNIPIFFIYIYVTIRYTEGIFLNFILPFIIIALHIIEVSYRYYVYKKSMQNKKDSKEIK